MRTIYSDMSDMPRSSSFGARRQVWCDEMFIPAASTMTSSRRSSENTWLFAWCDLQRWCGFPPQALWPHVIDRTGSVPNHYRLRNACILSCSDTSQYTGVEAIFQAQKITILIKNLHCSSWQVLAGLLQHQNERFLAAEH